MGTSGPTLNASWLLAMVLAAGCATVPPEPKQREPVEVVGGQGKLAPAQRDEFLAGFVEASGSEVVATTVEDIATLSSTPLYLQNDVQLLINGPETYESMMSAIEAAEHHVYLESYIFSDDEVGNTVAALLKEQSRKGIDVKVIYDSYGSGRSDGEFFADMESAGIEVMEFNPVNPLKGDDEKFIKYRDHRKILAVDGKVAYTGSINVTNIYAVEPKRARKNGQRPVVWRDTNIAVRGPAVAGFQQLFLDTWKDVGGGEGAEVHAADDWPGEGEEVVAIIASEGGDDVESEIFQAYLHAIEAARQRVWISQAYFAPDEQFLSRLKAAARRGVDVRINVPAVTDSEMVYYASRSRYGELLEAGVEIYEQEDTALHAKTAVIDGIWSTVGSSNLDYWSLIHNNEVNAVIIGRRFAEEMEAQFLDDLGQSRRIVLSEWKQRSLWKRLKEKLSWIVKYWL